MTVPHDLLIPTGPDAPPISLKAGQNVMVIKTPKGIYLRMNDKIIKIKQPGRLLGAGYAKSFTENSPSESPPASEPAEVVELPEVETASSEPVEFVTNQ